jgi:hypothetical protein
MILKTTQGDTPHCALFKTLEDLKNSGIIIWDIGMFLVCAINYFESPTTYGRPQLFDII